MSCPISLKYRKMSVSSDQNGVIQPLLTGKLYVYIFNI